ncbi:protein SHQ1 homolog isoform X2 [Dendronephthya gigantea]|uniref:protein SHQ1 homolog isoform X2 n=1 Tax=Dendronephthya gigantea TaxID=151771 RepID=UPI00106C8635|nr:protein SHQ1 homolog isoform X2 [Dendronephthya gigantea]
MLTPAFELGQDEKFVFVYMKTPYIKAQDVEYFIEENLFKFYVKPYFLRLNFPGKIIENGEESASYDVDKGLFTVRLPKLVPGAHFPDLDLVTKLLAPSGKCNISTPGIEVVSENAASNSDDEEDFDWEWSQEFYDEKEEERLVVDGCKYGFGNKKSGVFHRLKDELKDVVENPNPDELSYRERRLGRIASENEKFDEEHYLADLFDDVRIKEILDYVTEKEASFDDIEKKKLQQLPNREYVFEKKEENFVCYSLVDIIFAYAYNKRTTFGENTVESAWTISKLSPTLSWLERFTNVEDVLVACVRRSLSYPLFRNWDLSCRVLQDVKDIFKYGRRRILKCLLEILKLFNESEPRYLLNELYITDYCVWIQKVKEKKVDSLAKKLSQLSRTIKLNSRGYLYLYQL